MKKKILVLSSLLLLLQTQAQNTNQTEVPLSVLQAFSQEASGNSAIEATTNSASGLDGFASVVPEITENLIDDREIAPINSQFIPTSEIKLQTQVRKPNVSTQRKQKQSVPIVEVQLQTQIKKTAVPIIEVQPRLPNQTATTPEYNKTASVVSRKYVNWKGEKYRLRSPDKVKELYETLNYDLLWFTGSKLTPLGKSVIAEIKKSWQHGFPSQSYHIAATEKALTNGLINNPMALDILLSDAFITLKSHLANGIINPKKQFPTWNQKREYFNFSKLYTNAKKRGNVSHILKVNNSDYKKLQQAYLVSLASGTKEDNTTQSISMPARSLRPGDQGSSILALRKRLGLSTDSNIYDNTVKQAVKAYQKSLGLSADGIAGRKTIEKLNGKASSSSNTDKLAINMERLRWQRPTPSGNYIWVNIPAYKMAIRNRNKFVFESNIIVGRKKRPTPIFSDKLEYVVLSPYWNIPKTIYTEDKLPKLQKNAKALKDDMEVIEKATGKVVSFSSVNWKNGGVGFRLRQLPGPRNSLGKVKFLFPNKHAIYLHDTPNRRLFKKRKRALSSGCIRVERAEDLAVFLLKDMGFNRKRVKKESNKKKESWVNLKNKLRHPVFINYYTAWVDKSGKVRYSTDIYGYDRQLRKLYSKALKTL